MHIDPLVIDDASFDASYKEGFTDSGNGKKFEFAGPEFESIWELRCIEGEGPVLQLLVQDAKKVEVVLTSKNTPAVTIENGDIDFDETPKPDSTPGSTGKPKKLGHPGHGSGAFNIKELVIDNTTRHARPTGKVQVLRYLLYPANEKLKKLS